MIRRNIKEVHIYDMGEGKVFLTTIEKTTEINLVQLNPAVGMATKNIAKSATTQQDYLLIIYFHQEKKNISLVTCQFSTS